MKKNELKFTSSDDHSSKPDTAVPEITVIAQKTDHLYQLPAWDTSNKAWHQALVFCCRELKIQTFLGTSCSSVRLLRSPIINFTLNQKNAFLKISSQWLWRCLWSSCWSGSGPPELRLQTCSQWSRISGICHPWWTSSSNRSACQRLQTAS